MTEEDNDQTRPRLRLAAEPEMPDRAPAAESAKPASGPDEPPASGADAGSVAAKPKLKIAAPVAPATEVQQVPAPDEKKNLQLKRPDAATVSAAPDSPRTSPPKLPLRPAALSETPNSPAAVEQPQTTLPPSPLPAHKHKSLLVSIMMIAVLMFLLAACAYGLYYVLLRPTNAEATGQSSTLEPTDPAAPAPPSADPAAPPAATQPKAVSRFSQPIAKAKELVAALEDPEAAWTEDVPAQLPAQLPAPVEPPAPEVSCPTIVERPKPAPAVARPPVNTQQNAVTEFLQQSHIGGVRMGERPKLLLNGLNYGPGDLIDPATGLRFIGLRDKKIVFQDSQGIVYIKRF